MSTTEPPPAGLRVLLQRAQLSPERFARKLNRCAAELGLVARMDPKTPYKWLRGAHPREPWPGLAVELLSTELGCRIGVEQLGWRTSADSVRYVPGDTGLDAPWTAAGALAVGAEVVEGSAVDRRIFLLLTGSALTQPALAWLVAAQTGEPLGTAGRRVPDGHATAVEEITARLHRMDDQGSARGAILDMVRGQLRHVLDLLGNYRYEAATGLRLHAAAAELTWLAGWICSDTGQHAVAQRYWIAALHAAHAAGDRAAGANVLGSMSLQARDLAPREAVTLAEAALRGCAGASPRAMAILHSRLAGAQAKTRDATGARSSLDRAWEAIRATPPDYGEPGWSYWMDEAQLAKETAVCYLHLADWNRAERHFTAAIRRQADPRSRESASRHAMLARALAGKGEPEHACEVAGTAVDLLTEEVDSSRCVGHVRAACDALRPYRRLPAVRDLTERTNRLFVVPA